MATLLSGLEDRIFGDRSESGGRDSRSGIQKPDGLIQRLANVVRMLAGWPVAERVEKPDRRPRLMTVEDPSSVNITARDLMTDRVVTVRPDDGIERAARLMQEHDCSALPVVDASGRLVGMITDHDITVRLVAKAMSIACTQVSDCMSYEAFACHADDPVEGCIRTMSWHQVRRVPIVDHDHKVIGIISQRDLAWHSSLQGPA